MTEQVTQSNNELTAAAVTHLEIPTLKTLQEETAKFYAAVFGWHIDYQMMPDYGMTTNTQNLVSIGLPLVKENSSPVSNFYVHVEDIDEILKIVTEYGGKVISEKNMISEEIGFGATFTDLSDNTIGLFSPS